jgi:hypothetical protein
MRAWELQEFGLNDLTLVERAEPVPALDRSSFASRPRR